MTNVFVIALPPLSLYPEQPTDMSKCEVCSCPECGKDAWLSEKKKHIINVTQQELVVKCYICMTRYAKENAEAFRNANMVNL